MGTLTDEIDPRNCFELSKTSYRNYPFMEATQQ